MKKIFVHIGLPKTGTTTLQQYYFPFIDTFHYSGVNQPRGKSSKSDDATYRYVMNFINGRGEITLEKVLNIIESELSSQLLISEEMLTVSNQWIQKLEKLSLILRNFDEYTIVVTVRDPIKVSFSYYVETYERHFDSGKISYIDAVRESVHMKMYHYEYLFKTLYSMFPKEKVIALKFEDIFFDEGKSLENIFGSKQIEIFPSENKTKSNNNYKISTRGSKVDIPSIEVIVEAKKILNYSNWESFIPMIPDSFIIPKPIEKVVKNINFKELPKILTKNMKNADILREVALAFEENGDIKTALPIMQQALVLRPNGPFIKNKVQEYKSYLKL